MKLPYGCRSVSLLFGSVLLGTHTIAATLENNRLVETFDNAQGIQSAHSINWQLLQGQLQADQARGLFGSYYSQASSASELASLSTPARAIVQQDFNGDGYPDLVIGYANSGLQLFLNNQTNTPFEGVTALSIGESQGVNAIVAGDMDQDGDMDLITVGDAQPLRVYFNNGESANPFANSPVSTGATFDQVNALVLMDINHDGFQDLVLGRNGINAYLLHSQNLAAPFSDVSAQNFGSEHNTTALALGDFNQDGYVDLVVGNSEHSNELFLNNAQGFDSAISIAPQVNKTRAISVADINADGLLDIVEGNYGQANAYYLNNSSETPFSQTQVHTLSAHSNKTRALLTVDINQDGYTDLVEFNESAAAHYWLHSGNNDTPYQNSRTVDIAAQSLNATAALVGDFNQDGALDLAAIQADSPAKIFTNNAYADPFSGSTPLEIATGMTNLLGMLSQDFNLDGRTDLLISTPSTSYLWLNNGQLDTPYAGVTPFEITTTQVNQVTFADINLDGAPDLIFARNGVNQLLLNNHTANPFEGQSLLSLGTSAQNSSQIVAQDMNQDSRPDLVVINKNGSNLVYTNTGSTPWLNDANRQTLSDSQYDSRALLVLDFDKDGTQDILVGNFNHPTQVYLNTNHAFAQIQPMLLTGENQATTALVAMDYNGDALPDIVEINQQQSYLVLTNKGVLPRSGKSLMPLSGSLTNAVAGHALARNGVDLFATTGQNELVYFDEALNSHTLRSNLSHNTLLLSDVDNNQTPDLLFAQNNAVVALPNTRRTRVNGLTTLPLLHSKDFTDRHLATSPFEDTLIHDFNQDGRDDILVQSRYLGIYLYHSFDDQSQQFSREDLYTITSGFNNYLSAAGDIDHDGDEDLVILIESDANAYILRNNGSSSPFSNVSWEAFPLLTEDGVIDNVRSVQLSDVNRDGDLDLVITSYEHVNIYLHQDTSLPYSSQQRVAIELYSSHGSFVYDFNRDGFADLYIDSSTESSYTQSLLLNEQDSTLFNSDNQLILQDAVDMTDLFNLKNQTLFSDVNHDGIMDMFDFNPDSRFDTTWLFLGHADLSFSPVNLSTALALSENSAIFCGVQDVNNDGWPDVLVRQNSGLDLYVYLNTREDNHWFDPSQRVLLSHITNTDISYSNEVRRADINGDGQAELITQHNVPDDAYVLNVEFVASPRALTTLHSQVLSSVQTLGTEPVNRLILQPEYAADANCPSCRFNYWLSNNGGQHFYQVQPNVPFEFPTAGNQVVWRLDVDSLSASTPFALESLTISSNIAPVITGQVSLQTDEDTPIEIELSDLTVQDPDNAYPTDFTLQLSADDSENYTVEGNQVIPAANFHGEIHVLVSVSDGQETSAPFTLSIQVNSVTDVPSILGFKSNTPFNAFEEESFLITLSDLALSDPDQLLGAQSFSLILDNSATSIASAVSQGSGLLVTPRNGVGSSINLPVKLINASGTLSSAVTLLPINVQNTNDTPVIQGLAHYLSTHEEQEIHLQLSDLKVVDDNSADELTLHVLAGNNYTLKDANVILPDADVTGTLLVNVQVTDALQAASAVTQISVDVKNINDAPVITGQFAALNLTEDGQISLGLSDLIYTDADPDDSLRLKIQTKADDKFSYVTDPANAQRFVITPQTNYDQDLNVTVVLVDKAGAQSNEFSLLIHITAQNDAPLILGVREIIRMNEDTASALILDQFNIYDPDSDSQTWTLTVQEGEHYRVDNGNVLVPDTNFVGSLSVPVIVSDGQASSPVTLINVLVGDTLDKPVVIGQTFEEINEQGELTLSLDKLNIQGGDSSTFSLLIEQNSALYSVNYATNTVTFKPGVVGYVPVSVLIVTGGEPVRYNYNVLVNNVNDKPVVKAQLTSLSTDENSPVFISLTDFEVEDIDSTRLTLQILDGDNYTHAVKGNNIIVTPVQGFVGNLEVSLVVLDDNGASSAPFTAEITVRGDGGGSGGGSISPLYLLLLACGIFLRRQSRA